MHTANMQAIKALGRSDTFLLLEVIKKTIELICLLLVMRISVTAIAINMAVLTTLFTFVNAVPNIKLLNYSLKEQLGDIMPSIFMSLVMAFCVYLFGRIPCPDIMKLTVQVLSGIIIYIGLALITKNKELELLWDIVKNRLLHHAK